MKICFDLFLHFFRYSPVLGNSTARADEIEDALTYSRMDTYSYLSYFSTFSGKTECKRTFEIYAVDFVFSLLFEENRWCSQSHWRAGLWYNLELLISLPKKTRGFLYSFLSCWGRTFAIIVEFSEYCFLSNNKSGVCLLFGFIRGNWGLLLHYHKQGSRPADKKQP